MTDKPVKSAFPHDNLERGVYHITADPGMTLRDYFAARAMQSILLKHGAVDPETAERCYRIADNMMAAREKS